MPRTARKLSLLVVSYNSWRLCANALRSFRQHPPLQRDGTPLPYEVVVVDNCSPLRDPIAETEVEELALAMGGQLVRHDENGGYSKGMNLALAHASGDVVLVSNPDVLFEPGCVTALVRRLEERPDVGAAAPEGFLDKGLHGRLPPNILPTIGDLCALTAAALSPWCVRRYSARRTRAALRVWQSRTDVELDMLSGCCFAMWRSLIDRIGFFDERFPLYYEDTDLSLRIRRAGLCILQVAGAKLVHLYNRSGQTDQALAMDRYWVSRQRYYRKWYGPLGGALYGALRRLLRTRWAQRRAQLPPHEVHDLGAAQDKPVIRWPGGRTRFLVEIALDPHFYLAAGVLGEGSEWTPSDTLFAGFGPTTYYFRVCDVASARARQIGVWSFTRVFPPEWQAPSGAAARSSAAAAAPSPAAGPAAAGPAAEGGGGDAGSAAQASGHARAAADAAAAAVTPPAR